MTPRSAIERRLADPAAFRESLLLAGAQTGFHPRLIEKDFYCSLILADLEPLFDLGLVFKGGTALSKVLCGFFRLSEDLDFVIDTPIESQRSVRRELAAPVKNHLAGVEQRVPAIRVRSELRGHNQSKQYECVLEYQSALSGELEPLRVEIALREPIRHTTSFEPARTLLDFSGEFEQSSAESPRVRVMKRAEAYAEKTRAALCRAEPAIRDFFDLQHASTQQLIDIDHEGWLRLVADKIAIDNNARVDVSQSRLRALQLQLHTQLKPVLRPADFASFSLESAWKLAVEIASRLQ